MTGGIFPKHSHPVNMKGGSPQREMYQEEDCVKHCSPGVVMPPITIQATINSNFNLTATPTTTPDTRDAWGGGNSTNTTNTKQH